MRGDERQIVIFTGRYSRASAVEHVEALATAFPQWRFTIFQSTQGPSRGLRWRRRLRRFKQYPVSYPLEILEALARSKSGPRLTRAPESRVGLPELHDIDLENVEYRRVARLHDEDTLRAVRDLAPWLGIALNAPILKRSLFGIPELGTINLHKSYLPSYRGLPPGFWEIHDGASRTGVTIHWVDDGLDTGEIVTQRELKIPVFSTPRGLALQLDVLASGTLVHAVEEIASRGRFGSPQASAVDNIRREPSWATRRAVSRRARRSRRAGRAVTEAARAVVKDLVMTAYSRLWVPIRNRVQSLRGGCNATVLLYHRVSDEFHDYVTVGIEEFEWQMNWLRRHCEVVDLETLLQLNGTPRDKPVVAITFDDGYEDNYLAAVVLRRLGLPCTFFLSTGIVGTEQAFEHDVRRLGFKVPSLSWEQVDRMARWGFRVGNHTVNHTNLGSVDLHTALAEVEQARDTLEARYGGGGYIPCLAYPFGMQSDITEEVRRALPDLGIPWCCSAFGGVNPPVFDQLRIQRVGISNHISRRMFPAFVHGWSYRRHQQPPSGGGW